jgi:hypothetical protein
MEPSAPEGLRKPRCFVAYASQPTHLAESIETAIETIKTNGVVEIIGWKSLTVTGRVLLSAICEAIRACDVFIADVTGLNANVLFELGYAIARRKRIWLLLNPSISRARSEWDRFQLLKTVGFAPFTNSEEISRRLYSEEPYNKLNQDLFGELLNSAGPASKPDALLYLQCTVNTEAAMLVARRVSTGPIKSLIDDPQEVRVQPLSWYVQQVSTAFGVVCHFLSSDFRDSGQNNAKQAIVAGLAYGSSKPLLMMAHEPYESPLDYQDLLQKHSTAAGAISIFANWSLPLISNYEKRVIDVARYKVEERKRTDLRNINIGEPVAEFESDSVPDYFIATAAYTETIHSKHSIVVGRKGTGKTATLYTLTETLKADPRNHVCVIKPVAYELHGLMEILAEERSKADQGYLAESFWKFLLYTELTKSVYEELLRKPQHYVRTQAEALLSEYVEQNQTLIGYDFSSRLEAAVNGVRELQHTPPAEGRRPKISELLHDQMIAKLRMLLGQVLENKSQVTMLVDNLDKAWNAADDLNLLSDLLFSLLTVSRTVSEDFWHNSCGRSPVNLHFVLFLRSDIYAAMLQFASERDKLPVRLILWNDPELLKRLIEKRFMASRQDIKTPDEIWKQYFVPTIKGVPTWEYIGNRILPRPRDLIYLVKAALGIAINRGRTLIHEVDLLEGEAQYSRFAIDSLIVESKARFVKAEKLLLEFLSSSEVVTEHEISAKMASAGLAAQDLESLLTLLAELTFIGFEVTPNRFQFLNDERDAHKIATMARKTADDTTHGVRRFRIHPAFHSFLEITLHSLSLPGQTIMDL